MARYIRLNHDNPYPAAMVPSEGSHVEESASSVEPRAGRPCFHGRYKVVHEIGSGGFANTYLVWDTSNAKPLVLKQYRCPHGIAEDYTTGEREARIMGCLDHPQVPKCHDWFWDEDTGSWCLVMDLVGGKPLAHFDRRSFSDEVVAVILVRLLDVLLHLQSRGVLHRDISPANVMVNFGSFGQIDVSLIDFNISNHTSEDCERLPVCCVDFAPPEAIYRLPSVDAFMVAAIGAYFCNPGRPSLRFSFWAMQEWVPATPFQVVLKKALKYHFNERYDSIQDFESAMLCTLSPLGRVVACPSDHPKCTPDALKYLTAIFLSRELKRGQLPGSLSESEPVAAPSDWTATSLSFDSDSDMASARNSRYVMFTHKCFKSLSKNSESAHRRSV